VPAKDPITTSVSHDDGVAVLAVSGEIDLATIPAFEGAIAEALTQRPTALIVDLSAVDFLASAGLQALVATHEKVSGTAGFAVVAVGPATSRPIELTGLDQILSLHSSLRDAKAAVMGNPSR
jgi:anti-anti-sigma factor